MCQTAWYLHLIKTWDNYSAAVGEGTFYRVFFKVFKSCKMLAPCKVHYVQTRTGFEVGVCKLYPHLNLQNSSSRNSTHCRVKALRHKPWTLRPLLTTTTFGPCKSFRTAPGLCLSRHFLPPLFPKASAIAQTPSTPNKRLPQRLPKWGHPSSLFYSSVTIHFLSNSISLWPSELRTSSQTVVRRLPEIDMQSYLLNRQLSGPCHAPALANPLTVRARNCLVGTSDSYAC